MTKVVRAIIDLIDSYPTFCNKTFMIKYFKYLPTYQKITKIRITNMKLGAFKMMFSSQP